MTAEQIITGLTASYVSYWSTRQALKEAAQNIAYGVIKSGRPARLDYKDGCAILEDYHTGFEKRYLYLGESQQRDDDHGLGNFGEGWKLFLLHFARSGLYHRVETVGYTFWGTMTPTPHGVDVLSIVIEPNDRTVGTCVVAECSYEDYQAAVQAFVPLAGLPVDIMERDCIIPGRHGELWIAGVRIETDADGNPLSLRYAYHLRDRSLMNRDRSQVDVNKAYQQIKEVIANIDDEAFIKEYVRTATVAASTEAMDVLNGPSYISWKTRNIWHAALAEAHRATPAQLVIPSGDPSLDREAEYRGYVLLRTPKAWEWTLYYDLGIKRVQEVVKLRPAMTVVPKSQWTRQQVLNLKRAKLDAKRALGLRSITELPPIEIVHDINLGGVTEANGLYDNSTKTIYLRYALLDDLPELTRVLIHEAIHWQTGAGDNTPEFTRGFEQAILRLLGYK